VAKNDKNPSSGLTSATFRALAKKAQLNEERREVTTNLSEGFVPFKKKPKGKGDKPDMKKSCKPWEKNESLIEAMSDKARRAMFAKLRHAGGAGLLKNKAVQMQLASVEKSGRLAVRMAQSRTVSRNPVTRMQGLPGSEKLKTAAFGRTARARLAKAAQGRSEVKKYGPGQGYQRDAGVHLKYARRDLLKPEYKSDRASPHHDPVRRPGRGYIALEGHKKNLPWIAKQIAGAPKTAEGAKLLAGLAKGKTVGSNEYARKTFASANKAKSAALQLAKLRTRSPGRESRK
jgi:hypothetical protein